MNCEKLTFAALLAATLIFAAGPARALDPIDFALEAHPQDTGSAGYASDDDDEESFFSAGPRRGSANVTGTIGTARPAQRQPVQAQRAMVDVAATCRAVLADNQNLYNYGFLEGCKRAVAGSGERRSATR